MNLLLPCGLLLAGAGAVLGHLASPHQRWRSRPVPRRPALWGAAGLLAAAALVLGLTLQRLTVAWVLLTWLMAWWTLLPYLGAAWQAARPRPGAGPDAGRRP
jgi:hypothetical protein